MKLQILCTGGLQECPYYICDMESGRIAKIRDLSDHGDESELELSIKVEAIGYSYFKTRTRALEVLRKLGLRAYRWRDGRVVVDR